MKYKTLYIVVINSYFRPKSLHCPKYFKTKLLIIILKRLKIKKEHIKYTMDFLYGKRCIADSQWCSWIFMNLLCFTVMNIHDRHWLSAIYRLPITTRQLETRGKSSTFFILKFHIIKAIFDVRVIHQCPCYYL